MLKPYLCLLITVTFSTPKPVNNSYGFRGNAGSTVFLMKAAIMPVLVALSAAISAFACTCIPLPIPACQQLNNKRMALFVGKVQHVGFKTVLLLPDNYPVTKQVVTFQVMESFGTAKDANLSVTDWVPGNGSCAFPFAEGGTYLVDASPAQEENGLQLNSCGYTAEAGEAEDLLRFLRLARGKDGATIFGTVKEYVGEKNFVAKRNKAISNAAVMVSSADAQRTLVTDSSGWYLIRNLDAGEYVVRLDAGPEY